MIESGATLLVEGTEAMPVRLGPTGEFDAWKGVVFLPDSGGTVRFLEVSGSRSTGVQIVGAAPVFEDCRIGHSVDDGSLGTVLFAGMIVSGDGAHPIIRRCVIESVHGHSRVAATEGTNGASGAAGANGTFFISNGGVGGDGTAGSDGSNGSTGGSAFGIALLNSASVTIESSVIRGIIGGDGGRGGDGGDGGNAGAGGIGVDGLFTVGDGGDGGDGGEAGLGGSGGSGGAAIAILLDSPGDGTVVAGNAIYGVRAGRGGAGGHGGKGGAGGAGGAGGDCGFGCSNPGAGGDGGNGKPGAFGGNAGSSGVARGISVQFTSQPVVATIVNNSLALVVPPTEATIGSGGVGGAGGAGGVGGESQSPFDPDGEPGGDGNDGDADVDGAAAPVAPAIGVSASGVGVHVEVRNHATNLSPAGRASIAQFRAISGATMSVSGSCVSGHSVLAIGDVTFEGSVLESDPLFVAPPLSLPMRSECCTTREGQTGCSDNACAAAVCGKDASCCSGQWDQYCVELAERLCPWLCGDPLANVSLALAPESPAIDLGDNDGVPAFLISDLAGAARIADGDGDGDAVVDAGAYEATAIACGPDITCDGAVDAADLGAVLASWGPCAPPCSADIDRSGMVDGADLAIVLANWG